MSAFCEHERLAIGCTFCRWNEEQARIRAANAAYYAREDDQRMREGGGDD